jgi:predicted ribosomally synthesized peptide with nif11-like leader
MSVETAQSFITKVQSDEALRSEVIALGQDFDALVQLAGKRGYSFTAQDLQTAAQAGGYTTGPTISEEDLAQVAGGHEGCESRPTAWTLPGCC